MDPNGIQGNELKFITVAIDKNGNKEAEVHLPDQCSPVRIEAPSGLVSASAAIAPIKSDLATYQQLRDYFGQLLFSLNPIVASESYRIKTEDGAVIGSHFRVVFPSAEAGRSIVVWYRALL